MKRMNAEELARKLKIPLGSALEAIMKAELISAVLKVAHDEKLTHAVIAKRSGLARSAVTGILSGSLQKVTLDRVLKLVGAVGLTVETRVKKTAA